MSEKATEERVPTAEEKARAEMAEQFKAEVEAITERYEEVKGKLEEKGYHTYGYLPDTDMEIDSEFFIKASILLPKLNESISSMVEVMHQTMDTLVLQQEMFKIRLFEMNTILMEVHLKNSEAGISVTKEELDKSDAKKKIKILQPETPTIITDI